MLKPLEKCCLLEVGKMDDDDFWDEIWLLLITCLTKQKIIKLHFVHRGKGFRSQVTFLAFHGSFLTPLFRNWCDLTTNSCGRHCIGAKSDVPTKTSSNFRSKKNHTCQYFFLQNPLLLKKKPNIKHGCNLQPSILLELYTSKTVSWVHCSCFRLSFPFFFFIPLKPRISFNISPSVSFFFNVAALSFVHGAKVCWCQLLGFSADVNRDSW